MGLLEELKEKRQDAIENVAAEDLDIEATNLQLAEHKRVRALWVQKIADIDRAIAVLTPAEKPGSDALAEFMKRPGAVKHDGGPLYLSMEAEYELLFGDNKTGTGTGAYYGNPAPDPTVQAYRIISEPAGEGDAVSTNVKKVSVAEGYQHVVDAEPAPVANALLNGAPGNNQPDGEQYEMSRWHLVNGWSHESDNVTSSDPVANRKDDGPLQNVNYEPAPLIIADPSSVEELGEQGEPYSAAHEAEEPAQDLPPLLPPEPPKAATPEELEATGVIDPMASYWARKMAKELV